MVTKTLFLVLLIWGFAYAENELRQRHPDVFLNVRQLIQKYGYGFENHTVQTEDGYILELHRIPFGKNNTNMENKPAVLLVPGIFCSSADWVNMGPKNGLGFLLADRGYDVWLANYRGTTWSRKHTTLNPDKDKKQFWNYSVHEMGTYDVPAFIDYVLATTNQEKLFYVGHSQGSGSFFVATSIKPEYNKKIRLSVALAPGVYLDHSKSPFLYLLAVFQKEVQAFVEKYQFYEIFPRTRLLALTGQIFCNDDSPFQNLCASAFYIAAGYTRQLNKTMIPVITTSTPAGASIKQFQHYAQIYASKIFRQYDYGEEENLIKYGQSTPPEYDFDKVTTPVAVYYGNRDLLVNAKDAEHLISRLPNVVAKQLIKGFNHLDHMWGVDVVKLLYNNLFELMEHY